MKNGEISNNTMNVLENSGSSSQEKIVIVDKEFKLLKQ